MCIQAARGVQHLSQLGVLHRGLALRHLLLTNNDVVKVADFSLAVSTRHPGQHWGGGSRAPAFR